MDRDRITARRGVVVGAAVVLVATAVVSLNPDPGASRAALTAPAAGARGLAQIRFAPTAPGQTSVEPAASLSLDTAQQPPAPSADPSVAAAATSTDGAGVDPAVSQPGAILSTASVLALVRQHFPADQVGNAMAVSRCESDHSNTIGAQNRNGTRDWGVFQLNDGGTLQSALRRIGVPFSGTEQAQQLALDATVNIAAARAIYDSRGWAPWVCAQKTGIVAALYSKNPGPMYGRYDEQGLTDGVDLNRTRSATTPTAPVTLAPRPAPTRARTPGPPQSAAPTPTAMPAPAAPPTPAPAPAAPPPPAAPPTPAPAAPPAAPPAVAPPAVPPAAPPAEPAEPAPAPPILDGPAAPGDVGQ